MIYAEALEQQVGLLRWMKSPTGKEILGRIVFNSEGWEGKPFFDDTVRAHRLIVQSLERAEPFWWSPELTTTALTMAATLPSWTLRVDDLPDGAGFFWFASPIAWDQGPVNGKPQSRHYIRAISWLLVVDADNQARAGVVCTFWIAEERHTLAWPMYQWWWDIGTTWDAGITADEANAAEHLARLCRLIAASWALLGQQLFVAPHQRADRAAARRLKHDGYPHEPLIRVVQLRRVEHAPQSGEDPEPVDWSCRWIVRGHWRQQPYGPGQAQRRPTWISPYMKGPDEKPLKAPRATVFAVVR